MNSPVLSRRNDTHRNKSKKGRKNQEMIQSSITPDPGYHMENQQKYNKHHQHESRGHPNPACDHKAAMNRRKSITNTRQTKRTIHKRSTVLER